MIIRMIHFIKLIWIWSNKFMYLFLFIDIVFYNIIIYRMNPKMKCIIIIIIVLLVLLYLNSNNDIAENFWSYNSYYKNYCPSCNWRNRRTCSKCLNCGFCLTAEGTGECVPGDSNGPYFRSDCVGWEYGDSYQYYPYANIYPVVSVKSANPYFQKQIRKPYRWVPKDNN
jgi:hypothetical protein